MNLNEELEQISKTLKTTMPYDKMFSGIRCIPSNVLGEYEYVVLVGPGIWKEIQDKSTIKKEGE